GSFAVVGFVAMLVMAYFQWRTVHGLAEISAVLPPLRALGPGPAVAALTEGDAHAPVAPSGIVEKVNARLVGALEQLEKRLFNLEHASRPALEVGQGEAAGKPAGASHEHANGNGNGHGETIEIEGGVESDGSQPGSSSLKSLLEEGQKLL